MNNFSRLGIEIIIPTLSLLENAGQISFKYQITFYDAVYLALAEDLGDQFITADEVLSRKVKDLGFVQLLKNI